MGAMSEPVVSKVADVRTVPLGDLAAGPPVKFSSGI